MVGLGQTETTDQFALRQLAQVFLPLVLGAVNVDRMQGQRRLDAHHRTIGGIDALDFTRRQPVTDVIDPGATVFLRQGRAQKPQRPHFEDDFGIEVFVAVGFQDAWHQLVLGVVARRVAD